MFSKWKRAAWENPKTLKRQREWVELQLENERIKTRHLVGPDLLKTGNFWKVGSAYIRRSNSVGYSAPSSLLCLLWGGLHEAGRKHVHCWMLNF